MDVTFGGTSAHDLFRHHEQQHPSDIIPSSSMIMMRGSGPVSQRSEIEISARLSLRGISVMSAIFMLFGFIICVAWYPIFSSALQPVDYDLSIAVNQTIRILTPDPSTTSEFRITLPIQEQYPRLGIAVYSYISAGCPPMTAPKTVTTPTEFQRVKLEPAEIKQWQSFHLNRGSEITIDFIQEKGYAEFYILMGQYGVKPHKDHHDFLKGQSPNYRAFASPSIGTIKSLNKGNYTYIVDSDDLYTIVYFNPSRIESVFSLRILLTETNYDVSERNLYRVLSSWSIPPSEPNNKCIWNKDTSLPIDKQCIVVKGIEWLDSQSSISQDSFTESFPFQTHTTPDWMAYFFRCGLPFLVITIPSCMCWCCSSGETHDDLTQRITRLRQQEESYQNSTIGYPSETTPILVSSRDEAARDPISCPYCNMRCWGEGQFQLHLLRRHRETNASTVAQFPCEFCRTVGTPQIFMTEQALQVHIEREHGLRYERSVPVAEAVMVEGTAIPNYGGDVVHTIAVTAEQFQEDIPLAQSTIMKDEDDLEVSHHL
jgi:hypothetical protein